MHPQTVKIAERTPMAAPPYPAILIALPPWKGLNKYLTFSKQHHINTSVQWVIFARRSNNRQTQS